MRLTVAIPNCDTRILKVREILVHRTTTVLIHGLSETHQAWSRQVPYLKRSLDTIAYDIRGFGTSPAGAADGTTHQLADDLAQIIRARNTGPVWLVGFSMGGVIAQRFALDYMDLTAGLILIASSSTIGRTGEEFFRHRIKIVTSGGLKALVPLNKKDAQRCFAMGDKTLISEYQRLRVDAVRREEGYLNACQAMLGIKGGELTQNLGSIERPTLVMAGEFDPYCPPRASEIIASAIPKANLKIIPNVGHCVHWEAVDKTNKLIREFIQGENRLE